jgi:hypothetical protein
MPQAAFDVLDSTFWSIPAPCHPSFTVGAPAPRMPILFRMDFGMIKSARSIPNPEVA